jgi:hypothetical protein
MKMIMRTAFFVILVLNLGVSGLASKDATENVDSKQLSNPAAGFIRSISNSNNKFVSYRFTLLVYFYHFKSTTVAPSLPNSESRSLYKE